MAVSPSPLVSVLVFLSLEAAEVVEVAHIPLVAVVARSFALVAGAAVVVAHHLLPVEEVL